MCIRDRNWTVEQHIPDDPFEVVLNNYSYQLTASGKDRKINKIELVYFDQIHHLSMVSNSLGNICSDLINRTKRRQAKGIIQMFVTFLMPEQTVHHRSLAFNRTTDTLRVVDSNKRAPRGYLIIQSSRVIHKTTAGIQATGLDDIIDVNPLTVKLIFSNDI